jgi:hypothetical protein
MGINAFFALPSVSMISVPGTKATSGCVLDAIAKVGKDFLWRSTYNKNTNTMLHAGVIGVI